MKLMFRTLVGVTMMTLLASVARGQLPSAHASVSERGPHHRVWSRVTLSTNRLGKVMARTNSFTELETGMHVLRNGEWVESSPEIRITADGAEATDTPHKVSFGSNLNSSNAVTVVTADGLVLRSRILGLGYFDAADGRLVLFARLQDSFGLVYAPNRAVYPDAFDSLEADVELVTTKDKFEQNIILRAQPPSPSKWNMNPETVRLQVLTEFFNPPPPVIASGARAAADGDATLSFGTMHLGRGKAFVLGTGLEEQPAIPVRKRWITTDAGRSFLVEEVRFTSANQQLESLPTSRRTARMDRHPVGRGETLMAALQQASPGEEPTLRPGAMRLAKAEVLNRPGFVLDYVLLSVATDFTFKADTTYLCTNAVNLSGNTVFEGGAVVKFSTNSTATINVNGTVECRTEAYRPVVVTSRDDDTVGEVISGSTGTPVLPTLGSWLCIGASDNSLKHFRIAYASSGILLATSEGAFSMANMQFVKCRNGFEFDQDDNSVRADNCLFYVVTNAFKGGTDDIILRGQHLTINQAGKVWDKSGHNSSQLYLTNSLLVATSFGGETFEEKIQDHSPLLGSSAGVFQTVGAGAHYLVEGSTNRNAGTTNISAGLLAELRKKTTYPPIVLSNLTIATDSTLYPMAQRDTDLPDLGYHYEPLDYAFGYVRVTNCTLQVEPGTVIGAFSGGSTYSIGLLAGSTFDSRGTATAPNWISRYNTVQEQANLDWTDASGQDWSILGYWVGGTAPQIRCRFTKFSALANRSTHFGDYQKNIPNAFADCEFHGGNLFTTATSVISTNCLFDRVYSEVSDEYGMCDVTIRDSTYFGGNLQLLHFDSGGYVLYNNLFAWSTNIQDGDVEAAYNGYVTGSTILTPTNSASSNVVAGLAFLHGPLGWFYQPTTSAFLNVGSTTAELSGLYHYTVTTNLVSGLQAKETTSTVDMGYHYVALDGANLPIDTDGDGVPDYLEDVNGDGDDTNDPTSWETYDSPNGLASGSGLKVFTPLK